MIQLTTFFYSIDQIGVDSIFDFIDLRPVGFVPSPAIWSVFFFFSFILLFFFFSMIMIIEKIMTSFPLLCHSLDEEKNVHLIFREKKQNQW